MLTERREWEKEEGFGKFDHEFHVMILCYQKEIRGKVREGKLEN